MPLFYTKYGCIYINSINYGSIKFVSDENTVLLLVTGIALVISVKFHLGHDCINMISRNSTGLCYHKSPMTFPYVLRLYYKN